MQSSNKGKVFKCPPKTPPQTKRTSDSSDEFLGFKNTVMEKSIACELKYRQRKQSESPEESEVEAASKMTTDMTPDRSRETQEACTAESGELDKKQTKKKTEKTQTKRTQTCKYHGRSGDRRG